MRNNQKGFGLVIWLLAIVLIGLTGLVCYQLYQKATLEQNLEVAKAKKVTITKYQPKTIVAVGDIACDPKDKNISGKDPKTCQDAEVAKTVAKLKPDALLLLGDQQYGDGAIDKYNSSFAKNWGQFSAITYPAPGNHEYVTKDAAGYYGYFKNLSTNISKGYYSFSLGDWNIISLNSNCEKIGGCDPNSTQVKWLSDQLKSITNKCTLAFWHHPRFTSGKYFTDDDSKSRSLSFWETLEDNQADVILNGHDHLYERFAVQNTAGKKDRAGLRQFTVGTGGYSLYKQSGSAPNSQKLADYQFGVLKLELYKSAYKWEFVAVNGDILDDGQQRCN